MDRDLILFLGGAVVGSLCAHELVRRVGSDKVITIDTKANSPSETYNYPIWGNRYYYPKGTRVIYKGHIWQCINGTCGEPMAEDKDDMNAWRMIDDDLRMYKETH